MSDREGEDLTSSLTSYLQGYSTYSRIKQPRRDKRGTLTSASHNRRLLSSAVAVIASTSRISQGERSPCMASTKWSRT